MWEGDPLVVVGRRAGDCTTHGRGCWFSPHEGHTKEGRRDHPVRVRAARELGDPMQQAGQAARYSTLRPASRTDGSWSLLIDSIGFGCRVGAGG